MGEEKSHQSKLLLVIWVGLLLLTASTIGVSQIDLGFLNIITALVIASAKAGLVILFFMDLRHEGRLFRYILFIALLVLGLFIGLTFFDIGYRY